MRPVSVSVFLLAFAVYLLTAGPTIQAGDSGELITAAFQLGIPHPPGYPLFLLWEKMWMSVLPLGSIAFRATLGTALAAALAVTALAGLGLSIGRSLGVPRPWLNGSVLAIGLTVACSKTLWAEAVEAEVYTLHVLVLAVIGWLLATRPRQVWPMALLMGLGLAHHHSFFLTVPFLGMALWRLRRDHAFETGALFVLVLSLGLMTYGTLMIRSLANPFIDWGNPETFSGLLAHAVRKQYGTISRLPRTWELFRQQGAVLIGGIGQQITWGGVVLAVLGAVWAVRSWRGWAWGVVCVWILWTGGVVWLLNFSLTDELIETVEVFFIPAHVLMGLGAMLGAWALIMVNWRGARWVAAACCLALPLTTWAMHRSSNDRSRNSLAREYAENILMSVDREGVLLTKGDNQMFPLAHGAWVEGLRPDVTVYDDYAYIFVGIFGDKFSSWDEGEQSSWRETRLRELLRSGRPVCYTAAATVSLFPDVVSQGQGLVYRVVSHAEFGVRSSESAPRTPHPASELWRRYRHRGVDDPTVYKTYLASNIEANHHYFLGKYWLSEKRLAAAKREFTRATMTGYAMESMFNNVAVEYHDMGAYEEALRTLHLASEMNPHKAEIHWNIGTVRMVLGRHDQAVAAYLEALRIKPTYVEAWVKLGEAYFHAGNVQEAVRATEQGLALDPRHGQGMKNLGQFKKAMLTP